MYYYKIKLGSWQVYKIIKVIKVSSKVNLAIFLIVK